MTDKQLEKMNVSLAKKIGWTKFRKENTPEPLNTRRMMGIAPGNFRYQYVPTYTSNLAYAVQIVDHLTKLGYNFTLCKDVEDTCYNVFFYGNKKHAHGQGTRPAMAICDAFSKLEI